MAIGRLFSPAASRASAALSARFTRRLEYLQHHPRNCLDDPEVVEKARAAVTWCQAATKHTAMTDKKPWRYMLVPDAAVAGNMTIAGLAAKYERKAY